MLKLIACWDLKEHPIKIIIIKNHRVKISIEFPESANLEKSYFYQKTLLFGWVKICQKTSVNHKIHASSQNWSFSFPPRWLLLVFKFFSSSLICISRHIVLPFESVSLPYICAVVDLKVYCVATLSIFCHLPVVCVFISFRAQQLLQAI